MKQKRNTLPVDFYVTTVIMLGSLYFLVDALYISKLNEMAIRMPKLVLGLTVVLCAVELIKILIKYFKNKADAPFVFENGRNFLIGILLVLGYCIGLWMVGFIISTIASGVVYGRLYHYKKKVLMILYTVAVTMLTFWIFVKVLNVPLPQGLLFQWM